MYIPSYIPVKQIGRSVKALCTGITNLIFFLEGNSKIAKGIFIYYTEYLLIIKRYSLSYST